MRRRNGFDVPGFADYFWSLVNRGDSCWEWQRSKHGDGYGQIMVDGVMWRAHRVAYVLTHGPIPPGMNVLHHCDNPPCCRGDHLYAGTFKDNSRDTVSRGRAVGLYKPGRIRPPQESAKMADKLRGKARSPEVRAKISATVRKAKAEGRGSGWHHTPESKARIAEKIRALRASRPGYNDALKGRKRSKEDRRRISEGRKAAEQRRLALRPGY